MKATSLFLVGLLVGAAVVFLVRAAAQTEHPPEPPRAERSTLPEPHAEHADPAPDAQPEPERPDPGKPPENLLCPVMGNEVDPEIYVDYEGRRIGFCCPGCDKVFLEDPEKYLKKVDEELETRGVER